MVSFRKRIKIAPGVNLNLSKGGISTSFGVKGASVSVGKRGVYINNGLPGTGIYKRTKISRSSTKKSHTLPVEIGETTNTQNLSDAQVLLNDLRSKLEKLELRDKNVVIETETFNMYLFGTIRNILKDMGVNFQTLVKKSTNCVLVGDKRRPSKYTRQKIETYRQEGQKISLMKISVLDTPTISTTITEIPTNITQKNIVQNKKLQKIIRVLWCILGFIFLIILLATTT